MKPEGRDEAWKTRFDPERADHRSERADFRSERADFRPEKADFRTERADFLPERVDFKYRGIFLEQISVLKKEKLTSEKNC